MPYSLTYFAIGILTYFGVNNAPDVVNAASVILVAIIGLYGRYRAGGLHWTGLKL